MEAGVRKRDCFSAAATAFLLLAGCKIVSLEEDRDARARRGSGFDAARYVERNWSQRALPRLRQQAVEFTQLDAAMARNLDAAGREFGRRAGEGSPWTFVTRGHGTVRAIDRHSAEGSIEIAVDGPAGVREIIVQTGPVIVDTSIRDALPFLSFNDFADQIAFADVGRSLTARALADTRAQIEQLGVGDRVEFLGTFNRASVEDPIRLTAIRLARVDGQG